MWQIPGQYTFNLAKEPLTFASRSKSIATSRQDKEAHLFPKLKKKKIKEAALNIKTIKGVKTLDA